jgi:hypothetical protein
VLIIIHICFTTDIAKLKTLGVRHTSKYRFDVLDVQLRLIVVVSTLMYLIYCT